MELDSSADVAWVEKLPYVRKEGVRLFRLALSIDDSDPETLAWASITSAFMVGDSEREIEMADRAVALNPNSFNAWNGRGWWHWVVFNIPPNTASLPKGAGDVKKKLMPKGAIQSRTDFETDGYGGPCPPPGDKPHHYQIKVFAVDVDKLPDAKNDAASAALVGFDLNSHTLAKATLTGLYGR